MTPQRRWKPNKSGKRVLLPGSYSSIRLAEENCKSTSKHFVHLDGRILCVLDLNERTPSLTEPSSNHICSDPRLATLRPKDERGSSSTGVDIEDVTDGRLVSPSIAAAVLPDSYTGEGKEQEGEREEETLVPITIKVNKVNGEAADRGVDNGSGGNGSADKVQPAQPAATTTTRSKDAVPVDDAGLDRVSEAEGREKGAGSVGQACR